MATRNGSATWSGDLTTGSGELTVGEGVWTSAYTAGHDSTASCRGSRKARSNPEELLAAAHAACFSMALSLGLSEAGHPPRTIETRAQVQLRNVGGLPTIQQRSRGRSGRARAGSRRLGEQAQAAKQSCIISRALGGVKQINFSAELAS